MAGVPVVELEHRHRVLIGQRRVRPAEAFESLFVETAQPIIKRLVFGMRSRSEWHSSTCHYIKVIASAFGLLDEEIYDAVIYKSEEIAHIAQFYNLKSAC